MKSDDNLFPLLPVFLVFAGMKLCGVIFWSWWWITLPLWGPIALVFVVGLIVHLF